MALYDNLISYWKFDESSGNASDSSGNSKTLTNINSTAYATGKINNGADLESASSNYFNRTNDAYDVTAGSVSFWVKLESNPGSRNGIIGTDSTGAGTTGFCARLNNVNNKIDFFFGAGSQSVQSTTSLSTATWYHVVITWSTSNKKIYINGTLESTNSNAETLSAAGGNLYVGTDSTSTASTFDGILDEMGVWSRQISDAEVTSLYNAGSGVSYPFPLVTTVGTFTFTGITVGLIDIAFAYVRTFVLTGNPVTFTLNKVRNIAKNLSTWTNQVKS